MRASRRASPASTGIHVDGAAPPAMLTSPYSVAVGRRTWSMTAAMPSSVDASAATGDDGQALLGERRDVLVEVLLRPADRDDGGACLGGHPRDGGADAAATGAGHHDDAAVQPQKIVHAPICPDNIWCSAYCRTLFRSGYRARQGRTRLSLRAIVWTKGLDSVRGHDVPATASRPPSRYTAPNPTAADGWRLERLTAPSRLFGANGLRTGPDGRVYVAQVTGSQISALDLTTGRVETVSAKGGDIIAPDDVAFDASGNLYATEVMDGRVSVRDAGGRTRVLRDDLPCANGITVHQDRLFIGEMPRRRAADGTRPRTAASPRILLEEHADRPTRWRSAPTGCCTSR